MASVYKSLSKSGSGSRDSAADETASNVVAGRKSNKQRVLILSSRGVTFRYGARSPISHASGD